MNTKGKKEKQQFKMQLLIFRESGSAVFILKFLL